MNKTQNPYVGPRTFQREERHLFFGRDRESRDLSALVLSEQLVLFYAQSGAGKSSLLNTRLIPELEENLYEVFPIGRVSGEAPVDFTPENIYIYNLMRSLIRRDMDLRHLAGLSLSQFLDKLNEDEDGYFYDSSLKAPIRTNPEIIPWPHALIIDQFEELFSTNMAAWEKREYFFLQLAQAMEADPNLAVVLVMREDYIAHLDPYAHLVSNSLRIRYYMQRLGREAGVKAVQGPVEKLRPFADEVAENLIDNLASIKVQTPSGEQGVQAGQYVEPVQLQVVCHNLWENLSSEGTQITNQDLLEVGDINESLERYYDQRIGTVAKKNNIQERLIREWFETELITSYGTRNMVLRNQKSNSGLSDDVIQSFQGDLIRADMRAGQMWYELSHDRLIEPIRSNNKKWFEKNLSLFQRQAGLWAQGEHSESLLLRGPDLQKAEEETKTLVLTNSEQSYLDSCRALREREERDRKQRRTIVAALFVSVVLFLITFYFGLQTNNAKESAFHAEATAKSNYAVAATAQINAEVAKATAQASLEDARIQKDNADRAANIALTGNLAAQANSVKEQDHALALLLSLEAFKHKDNLLTRTTLFQLLQYSPYTRLFGFKGAVSNVAASPDGKWIAVASLNQITLINAGTKQIKATTTEGIGIVNSLAFNADGSLLAAGGCIPEGCTSNGQITIWDVGNSNKPLSLIDEKRGVNTAQIKVVTFGPDGKYLASGSYDKTIVLWGVTDSGTLRLLGAPLTDQRSGAVYGLAFSPDGKVLASSGDEQSIFLWDVSNPSVASLIGLAPAQHTAAINSLTFSPGGLARFASASDDGTVVLWDWDAANRTLNNPIKLQGHTSYVKSVAFNTDGTQLASASFDNSVILWDVQTGEQIGSAFKVHQKTVNAVAFGAGSSSSVMISGSNDQTIILWDLATHRPLNQPIQNVSAPIDLGKTATRGNITATANGQQIQLFGQVEPLSGHTGAINTLSFYPQIVDNRILLASASDDQSVILWDVSNAAMVSVFLKLNEFENPVTGAYFEQDQLVTVEGTASEGNQAFTKWIINPEDWAMLACEAARRNLTETEWEQYLPGLTYRKTCENYP